MIQGIPSPRNKGQALLEAVVALPALMAFAVFLLGLLAACAFQTYLQFISHEFLICRETSDPWSCEKKFRAELKSTLPFGRIESLWAIKEPHRQRLELRLSFSVWKERIRWLRKDEIQLPLRGS